MFSREFFVSQLDEAFEWDVIIIGGGATGLGVALDSASRGYSTLLLEQSDFAKGTSSRSTKLIHGGVRYLARGNFRLVYQALYERGLLLRNAAHLVGRRSFIIPCYSHWERWKYLSGLKLYDWLSGSWSMGPSSFLSAGEMKERLPGIDKKGLKGGVEYFDGQFDDARLAINLAQTAAEKGAVTLNYFRVTALQKKAGRISGVIADDMETGKSYSLKTKAVVNAAGVFVDAIISMDDKEKAPLVRPSQGAHLVLNGSVLQGGTGVMIPETKDGRVLFAIPWHGRILAGTTDTPLNGFLEEPLALKEEIRFIMETLNEYLSHKTGAEHVLSVFAGLRPLPAMGSNAKHTRDISRDHKIVVSPTGLVTILGGKWTTYRKMAEDTLTMVIRSASLKPVSCMTRELRIHGCSDVLETDHLGHYGTDAVYIRRLWKEHPSFGEKLLSAYPFTRAEVVWAVRNEMARKVEDVLARRLRLLFLDAAAAIEAAPLVAGWMREEMGYDDLWKKHQVEQFESVAKWYRMESYS